MKLHEFFSAIAPFLEGRETHPQAASALYGTDPLHADHLAAHRLALYGRFCRTHRFEALESTFAESREAIVRHAGEPAWEAFVGDYFRVSPMHHAELNENGSELPAFLAREAAARGLPAFVPELADLEWWSFRTRTAPDDPLDTAPDSGPLRLGATVELRPYTHDLAGWLEARSLDAPGTPDARACVILFWRDRDLDSRFAEADSLELAVLHAVVEGRPFSSAAERAGANSEMLEETVADLLGAGVLLGKRAE